MTRVEAGIVNVHRWVNEHAPHRTGEAILFIAIAPDGDSMEFVGDFNHCMMPTYLRQLAYVLEGGINHAKDT